MSDTVTKRILNCIPSRDTERDWTFRTAVEADILAAPAALPKSVDLREPSWWAVNDQGKTGSCVGWALADSVLRWHFVKAGRLAQNELLSPRFIWMASKEFDEFNARPTTFIEMEGTSLKTALDIARKFGSVTNEVLPLASHKLYQGRADTFYATAAQLKIASYFNLDLSVAAWRTWLAENGPILVRLNVDATFAEANAKNSGVLDTYFPATTIGGHAVALVGYTPDRFIVRNSWGTEWADGGYAYASLPYAQAAFTEAYGVSL